MPTGRPRGPVEALGPAVPASSLQPDAIRSERWNPDADLWEAETVTTSATGAVRVDFARPATKIEILEREGIVHYIGLGRQPTTQSYDLLHPGNGELSKRIKPTGTIFILAASAPTLPVEVLALAGDYVERGH